MRLQCSECGQPIDVVELPEPTGFITLGIDPLMVDVQPCGHRVDMAADMGHALTGQPA